MPFVVSGRSYFPLGTPSSTRALESQRDRRLTVIRAGVATRRRMDFNGIVQREDCAEEAIPLPDEPFTV